MTIYETIKYSFGVILSILIFPKGQQGRENIHPSSRLKGLLRTGNT
jgi:hypothetical protein